MKKSFKKKSYIISIDQGTTSTRAIIFDNHSKIVASSQLEFSQICPKSGWVEHNPEEIWETTYQVIKEAMNSCDFSLSEIDAIGITNQRETSILWDKETGEPLYNAIVWQSRQSQKICEDWIKKGYEPLVKDKCGLVINPYFSASKIKWIFDHVPGAYEKAIAGKVLFGTVDTYLVWKLTNGLVHVTDYTNASRTMLYNIKDLTWDEELLSLFNIPKSILPRVVSSSEIVGYATCFDEIQKGVKIPIASLIGDQQAALFGQCCFQAGAIKSTYGTGCFILMNTLDKPIVSKSGLLTTIAWGLNGKVEYALEGSVFVAGSAVQWLRDQMTFFKESSECEHFIRSSNPSNGVYVVPAFVGLGTPYWDNDVRGAIFGITRATTKENIISAVLEGIAYQAKDVMDVMKKEAGVPINYLGVDGGACTNNYLMQFQADLLDVKLIRPICKETTALGAMYLAGLAIGSFESIQEIQKMHRIEQVFVSNMTPEERLRYISGWEKAIKATMAFK